MYAEISVEDIPVDKAKFCPRLNAKRPANCDLANPPPSPGIDVPGQPAWQPNGCGTGGIGGWFQNFVLQRIAGDSYSGNLNSPYSGVSFEGACNSHDQCWAGGGARYQCDNSFSASMLSACSGVSSSQGASTCTGFANLYHGAVTTTNGSHSAYATSTQNRVCAIWASDMRENGCAN